MMWNLKKSARVAKEKETFKHKERPFPRTKCWEKGFISRWNVDSTKKKYIYALGSIPNVIIRRIENATIINRAERNEEDQK